MTAKKLEEFDEEKRAREIIGRNSISNKVDRKDILLVAKYFYNAGIKNKKLKDKLIKFCESRYSSFNLVIYRNLINESVKKAEKYPMRKQALVEITSEELKIIRSFPQKYAKVLFVMLVHAKYGGIKINRSDKESYYCNYHVNHILAEAKTQMNNADSYVMLRDFFSKGVVKPTLKDVGSEYSYEVCFVSNDSEVELYMQDMNNIIEFFPDFCEKCGKVIEKTGRRQKYCSECFAEERKIQIKNNVRKYRNKM